MINDRETEELEFKKSVSELKEGVISLSSMLNKRGHGVLLFGVKNDGLVVGQQVGEMTTTNIANEIKNHLQPHINPKIDVIEIEDKKVIKVEVEGVETPYSAYGRYFKRCDDQDLKMSNKELEECFLNKDITYSKWEKEITKYTADDVDENLLINYIDKANELNRMDYRYVSIEDALTRLGLMEKGYLNNAGYYLFSNKKPIMVKFARFASDECITFIDNRQFFGNIFECIDESYKYIMSSINFNAAIKDFIRVEKCEIPLEALREIIVNSFAHMKVIPGDYNEIIITPSKVKIYNPGVIAFNKSPLDFANGTLGSKIRNPLIALTLYKNKTIEAFGTGFRRVFEICKKENVPYYYSIEGNGFAFYFERKNTSLIENDNRKSVRNNNLTASETKVLDLINEEKRIDSISKAASKLNLSNITIQRALSNLVSKELIVRNGSNKEGYWKLK